MGADDGISHGLNASHAVTMVMSAFAAVAFYNVVELAFIIAFTFKRRKGLYFWSFVVATAAIVPYTLGFMFKFFDVIPTTTVSVTLIVVGWCCMVTGQSVVLYSRLHLVVREPRILRLVLGMIIFDTIVCHLPIVVLVYGSNSSNPGPFVTPYSIYEKVQITVFFLQELTISCLYVFSTVKVLRPSGNIKGATIRRAMTHLIYINVVVVLFDLSLLATEYIGQYEIQVIYKAALYSIKLKLEFRILNQLMELTRARSPRDWSRDQTTTLPVTDQTVDTAAPKNATVRTSTGHLSTQGYSVRVSAGKHSQERRFSDGIEMVAETHVTRTTRADGRAGRMSFLDDDEDRPPSVSTPAESVERDARDISMTSSQERITKDTFIV